MRKIIFIFLLTTFLMSCSLAPTYHRPNMIIPTNFKEAGKWIPAHPAYAASDCGPWWERYHDVDLTNLEESVTLANQNLQVAYARYMQAHAESEIARSTLFPQLTGLANPQRIDTSQNIANPLTVPLYNDVLIGGELSYEVDLWGRVRNMVLSAKSLERASAADLAGVDLSLHAELASDYFALRGDDEAQRILDKTVKVYKKALYLTRQRYWGGASPVSDVDQAEAQLKSAETLAADIRLQRAQLEHAIAVLIGVPPAEFTLLPHNHEIKLVSIAPGIPAALLQRRPDVAAAEQRMIAANADIGVARAAFYPDLMLLGTVGYESQILSNLFTKPSVYWSIGPSVTQMLFDGGRLQGFLDRAKASYSETVANYRQTVLTAFQQVEDSLVAIYRLNQEVKTQRVAVIAADRAVTQAYYRYRGGIITYLGVVVTQNTALQTELTDVDIRTRRQIASVQLIKAIGGGWSTPA